MTEKVSETVRIRIALAVDWMGTASAVVVNRDMTDDYAFTYIIDSLEPGERRYITEVEVQLPPAAAEVIPNTTTEVKP